MKNGIKFYYQQLGDGGNINQVHMLRICLQVMKMMTLHGIITQEGQILLLVC